MVLPGKTREIDDAFSGNNIKIRQRSQ
jgi:hypothetical protein